MIRLENRIPPPLVMLGIAAAMATSLSTVPAALSFPFQAGITSIFFLAAGVFGFPAFSAFNRAKTTINPVNIDQASTLVTSGIYQLSRNPMYVGLALLLCAWAACLARPIAAFGPILFVVYINQFQILPEERVLLSKFGEAYEAYRQSVRRWL
jgi:protein-S-isoprenylcysteine O-methyltransferase Ste14